MYPELIGEKTASVRHLAKMAPILSESDTLSHASHVMREFNVGALAVAGDGRVIGLIREEDLLEPLSQESEVGKLSRVGEFAVGDPVTIPGSASPQQALRALQWTSSPALPVVEEEGLYRGMLSRADLLAYWGQEIQPPRIGGMATPFGVFLTGSGWRGGVGDLSLVATGLMLGLLFLIVAVAQDYGAAALERATGWPIAALVVSPPTGLLTWMDGVSLLYRLLPFFVVLLAIRLSPLAGYHAGEHQTVWAIERGEPLTPESVARMPRPHPRCGTNLLVGLVMFEVLKDFSPELAFIFTALFWRRVGHYVQLYLTTRPATPKQLESGIRAGKELLEKYRENPGAMASRPAWMRIWNLGLLQSFIGMGIVFALISLLAYLGVASF
jgi:CBS domain-containing protein